MGLHGSEYWTYAAPPRRRAARQLTEECLPVSSASGLRLGLADRVIEERAA